MSRKDSFIADQRGAASLEMLIVYPILVLGLLLPLADVAIAGFRFIAAHQALRDMGQRTQYSAPDATDSNSISTWQNLYGTTTISGYTVSATVKCGDAGNAQLPCASTDFPKYLSFQTSFTLSPMVLGSVLCSTCTVNYSQRFQ
ncbi:hypothetical protein [Bradyrhizobium sp. OAE829]|uniref:hypothetical protein n=1 Tax=Bradyrhizobium sp. OAE829 TaxID=2663807 RepID=UPI00178A802F